MTNFSKEDAIKIVTCCAEQYQQDLEGKNLLFICCDKHQKTSAIEFSFYDYNYLHLTGLKLAHTVKGTVGDELSATEFYKRCLTHKLSPKDFALASDGTTQMKLEVLPLVICKNLSANMIGNYNSSRPKLYTEKLLGSTTAFVGFVKDAASNEYVPNTLVQEDLRKSVSDYKRIIAAYRKSQDEKKYSERVYIASKTDWSKITFPEKYSYLPLPSVQIK